MSGFYSRASMRQAREERESREVAALPGAAAPAQLTLDQISVDAPFDDAVLTVWNGERWVAYDAWLATSPIIREESPPPLEKGMLAPAMARPPRGEERQIELPMAPEAANE